MAAKSSKSLWVAAVLVVGLGAAWSFDSAAARPRATYRGRQVVGIGASSVAGSRARFVFLARQHSNSCTLEPSVLERTPDTMRLQGSCCSAMNLGAYRSQVKGLHAYPSVRQIPKDPYDIPVTLAKKLLGYDRTLGLNPTQTRAYEQAMRSSRENGPCCCHCWRWSAFRGLSKYLIADRGWSARPVATVIDLLDGCGGAAGRVHAGARTPVAARLLSRR